MRVKNPRDLKSKQGVGMSAGDRTTFSQTKVPSLQLALDWFPQCRFQSCEVLYSQMFRDSEHISIFLCLVVSLWL